MKFLSIVLVLCLTGCAQWNELSEGEKTGVIVAGAVVVGASIVANSQKGFNQCISTRSLETGCPAR